MIGLRYETEQKEKTLTTYSLIPLLHPQSWGFFQKKENQIFCLLFLIILTCFIRLRHRYFWQSQACFDIKPNLFNYCFSLRFHYKEKVIRIPPPITTFSILLLSDLSPQKVYSNTLWLQVKVKILLYSESDYTFTFLIWINGKDNSKL